jgi:hypothetical protein
MERQEDKNAQEGRISLTKRQKVIKDKNSCNYSSIERRTQK